jgi:hypothetical protein
MDWFRRVRSGLLMFLFLSLFPALLLGQDDGESDTQSSAPLNEAATADEAAETVPEAPAEQVAVETILSSAYPVLNTRWPLTFLVDYPYPQAVNISPPEFPPELVLDEVRTEPHMVPSADGAASKRWTSITFVFIPLRSGTLTIGSFTVSVLGKRAYTREITVSVLSSDPSSRKYRPTLAWEPVQKPFFIGEGGTLVLRLLNWDPGKASPAGSIQVDVPEQAILEETPLTNEERARGVALRLSLIPLAGTEVVIPRSTFQHEGYTLEIPRLLIPLHAPMPPPAAVPPPPESEALLVSAPSFPAIAVPAIVPFMQKSVTGMVSRARSEWEGGKRAEALALIRQHERDSLSGPVFVDLRCAMEAALGLNRGGDEWWYPPTLLLLCGLGAALLFCLIRGLIRAKTVLVTFAVLLCVGALIVTSRALTKEAVLRSTAAYYVPETSGAVSTHFREGQGAFIRLSLAGWVYVETLDQRAAWVPQTAVVEY